MLEWPIPQDVAEREIGPEHIKRLKALRQWLYGNHPDEDIEFRTAPSLVARCEVGLFDISMPRFAFRAYLTKNSFVNARRIETFCELATSWGQPPPGYHRDREAKVEDRVKDASSCIGDSLLEPPEERVPACDYHVLTTELGRAYGERTRIEGTPFVNHIRLGGGLCAQAVCFMATALMQDAVRGVYGVGEITALASPHEERVLDLGGMNQEKICNYFNHPRVGLSAQLQTLFLSVGNISMTNTNVLNYAEALRAYVLSDVPVILPVDFGRMCGHCPELNSASSKRDDQRHEAGGNDDDRTAKSGDRSLFHLNGLANLRPVMKWSAWSRTHSKILPRPHALLVVGCRQPTSERHNRWEFLVNDPTTYPFLKASATDLAKIRPYSETNEEDLGHLGPIRFISVAPREVRLPLVGFGQRPERRDGLTRIADNIQGFHFWLDVPPRLEIGEWLGEIRLVDLRLCLAKPKETGEVEKNDEAETKSGKSAKDAFRKRLERFDRDGVECLWELASAGKIPAKWSWVQYCQSRNEDLSGSTIWLWDATVPTLPPELTDSKSDFASKLGKLLRDKYLLAVLVRDADEGWQLKYPAITPPPQIRAPSHVEGWQVPVPACEGLRPALISSFCTRQLGTARDHFPENAAVDLYAFMHPEVRHWLKRNPDWKAKCGNRSDPVTVMGALADDKKAIADMAKHVTDLCNPHTGRPIVALTSFIPEITSLQPDSYRQARNALRFLLNFAHALRGKGQPLRTIELVAGSRIGGIWPDASKKGQYMASRTDEDTARRRVLSVLGQVLTEYADQKPDERLFFSIEMEPGPLFLLYDWNSLVGLCREIGRDPLLSKFVGVNLDIAHWILAGNISPEQVWDTPEVRDRIVHAHIAGHHRCSHLGDLHVDDLNKPEDFRPWIDLLRQIAADWRHPDLPQFSGHVSLEYEAAKKAKHVTDCYAKARDLLRGI